MMEKNKPKIVVILGPTASGKSDLAVKLARRFNGEVISADSRQVYKDLDIGSGKITKREMKGVRHYLLDVASPSGVFTVQRYQKLARRAIKDILRRGKLPIICGGTGLYIDSLIYNTQFPQVPPNAKLRANLEKKTTENLFEILKKLDRNRAGNIDRNNRRRLIRAIEIAKALGHVPQLEKSSPYDVLKIGIRLSPSELKKRIEKRLMARLPRNAKYHTSDGRQIRDIRPKDMIQEVEKLHYKNGIAWKRLDDLGLEYRYISRYLKKLITYDQMRELITKESLKYTKRQMTWFKRDKDINWLTI